MKKTCNKGWIIILLIIAVAACNQNPKNQDKKSIDEQINKDYESMDGEHAQTYYRIPTPEEVMSQIDLKAIDFNDGDLSDAASYKKFLSLKAQSLNMGIYMADLAYLTLLEQNEASLSYYEAINGLSEQLRIKSALNDALLKRIAQNIGNTDSMLYLSRLAYNEIINYLEDNQKDEIIAMISVGTFIETLYLSMSNINYFEPENKLIELIVDQRFTFDNIYYNALIYKDNNNISDLLPELKKINQIYQHLELKSSDSTKLVEESDKMFVLEGGNEYSITEEQYLNLAEIIETFRSKIIHLK